MLSDFTKLNTFLTVVREKSFSKASAKLGISQPAVTQQMRYIEDYLDTKVLDRKKNGIRLTKEGEKLLTIAQKLQKSITTAEQQLINIINKDITFVFGASKVIGDYILPTVLNDVKVKIDNEVSVTVDFSQNIINDLLDKKIDMALIESPIFQDGIIYRDWMEDEVVIFSNQPLPKRVRNEDLQTYKWVCRDPESHTRKMFKEYLEISQFDDCDSFNVITESSSLTSIMNTVLHSSTDDSPTTSIASLRALQEYVDDGKLYITRLPRVNMKRTLYIAYLKEKKHDPFVDSVLSYLMTIK
ncbi:MAG TPA: LysR family transcriptional regulator [Arcobacter sp.]|jgi:DNA-binding transcriptional LysR family regulator|nr:LysR family transcriptional regulator [Arcobacter sp.]